MDDTRLVQQLAAIEARLEQIDHRLDALQAQHRWWRDVVDEFSPIARQVMGVAVDRMAGLEQRGYFTFAREAASVVDRVVTHYSADDVRQLGDNVVRILDTVKAVTQPAILAVANEATAAIQSADQAEPTGVFGMLRASNDADVRKGLAVAMQVLRHVGRAATRVAGDAGPTVSERQRRLAAALGPRLASPTAGAAASPAPRATVRPAAAAPATAAALPATVAAAVRTEAAFRVDGFDVTDDGFLADASTWTPAFAERLAQQLGVTLTERHWALIRFVRDDFAASGVSPNIRRVTKSTDITTKELYGMFPTAPAIYAARIAGLPKPAGCI